MPDDDGFEQFVLSTWWHLKLQGHEPDDDSGALLLLMERGYTPEGAASVIIAGRR